MFLVHHNCIIWNDFLPEGDEVNKSELRYLSAALN